MALKPPAGMDPTYDWSSYANRLTADSDTDKKRTAAAAAGIALITKNIFDDELTKNTVNKLSKIESDKGVTDSLITKRFTERDLYINKIKELGGQINISTNDKGDVEFNIDNKDAVKNKLRKQEVALAQENLPLKGYSDLRVLTEASKEQAFRKADLRYVKLVDKKNLYDWSLRTKEEAQSIVEPLYRAAAGSLNKSRYRDIIAKKFTEITGNYVENPQDTYLKEARRSVEKAYNLRDTEYSKLLSKADKEAQIIGEEELNEILTTLNSAKDNPNISKETQKKIESRINLLDPPKVQALSLPVDQANLFIVAAGNAQFGDDAMKDPAKALAEVESRYRTQSLIAGGKHDPASLYLSSLPMKKDKNFADFHSPSDRVKLLTKRDVDLFMEKEKEKDTMTYPTNPNAQEEYEKYNTKLLQFVTIGNVNASGGISYSRKELLPEIKLAHDELMYGYLKEEIIDELIKLDEVPVTSKNKNELAGSKLKLEYKIASLAEQYKNVNKGDAYETFNSLYNTNIAQLQGYQTNSYDGQLASSKIKNNAGIILRVIDNIINTAKNSGDVERAADAQKLKDSGTLGSMDTIARVLTLSQMTAAYGNSGHVTAQWYRRNAVMIEDLLYDIAVELDRNFEIPNINVNRGTGNP